MIQRSRIYLDNAATSWPKPQAVYDAVDAYQRQVGAVAGRGSYLEADEVGRAIHATRAAIARLIDAEDSNRVIFTFNGTDSLNLAIHGVLQTGDHVITTVAEHNSVLRPLRSLEKEGRISVTRVTCDSSGVIDPGDVRVALRPETKLIIVTHASNVTGAIQPVSAVGKIAREHNILFLVDAAQSLGHIPFSVQELGADLLAAPGHKGLLGPLGTGILYLRPGIEELVRTTRQGGTGNFSSDESQPNELPEKYESGNLNFPGLVGLRAGVQFIEEHGVETIREHAIELTDNLMTGLLNIPEITIYGPQSAKDRVGIVGISFMNRDSTSIANHLEEEFRIQVRGGFQCAALMHRALGTLKQKGTVRISLGAFSTHDELEYLINSLHHTAFSKKYTGTSSSCPCTAESASSIGSLESSSSGSVVVSEYADFSNANTKFTDISSIPGLVELWNESLGDNRVCVAILDGPAYLAHPSFHGSSLRSFTNEQLNTDDATKHGTQVASIIFGQHDSKVKGVAPHCNGVVIPIYRTLADGSVGPCSQTELAKAIERAIDYAEEQKAEALVINISGGQFSKSEETHPLLQNLITKANKQKVLIVAAAGNHGCSCTQIPGVIPSVLTVGAMSIEGAPLNFSNWGTEYLRQGILAVGENILVAQPANETTIVSGTSYATPIVSGVAALLLSLQLRLGFKASALRVREAIIESADGCEGDSLIDCRRYLAGRLSINQAMLRLFQIGGITDMNHNPSAVQDNGSEINKLKDIRRIEPDIIESKYTQEGTLPSAGLSCPIAGIVPASSLSGLTTSTIVPVYAIGSLSYDFDSMAARQAMQRRMKEEDALVQDPSAFMRHIFQLNADGSGRKEINLHEARRFFWVLEYGRKPLYVVRPSQSATESEDLTNIAFDYLEQQGLADINRKLFLAKSDKKIEASLMPDYVAIAGRLTGEIVTLLESGYSVPVLVPDYDLTDTWNLDAFLMDACEQGVCDKKDETQIAQFRQIIGLLHKFIEPLGDTPEKRAKNFVVSHAVLFAANSVAATSNQTLVLRSLDVVGDVGGKYPYDQVILIKATFIDISNAKDIYYAIDYLVNVSQPKPYFESAPSPLGFA